MSRSKEQKERYKKYARTIDKRLILLGLKGHENPVLYARDVKAHNVWNKAHRDRCNAANKRYRRKLANEAGSWSRHDLEIAKAQRREARLRRIRELRQAL